MAQPALVVETQVAKGSVALEIVAKAKAARKAKVFWKTKKANSFDAARSTPELTIKKSDDWQTYRFRFTADDELTGLRFRPGREVVVKSVKLRRAAPPVKLALQNALATFSQQNYAVSNAIDGKLAPSTNGWAVSPQVGKTQLASFETKEEVALAPGSELTFTLKQQFPDNKHSLGRFLLAVTNAPRPVNFGIPADVKAIFAVSSDKRTIDQKNKLVAAFKKADSARNALEKRLAEASAPLPLDPKIKEFQDKIIVAKTPVAIPPRIARLRRDLELSKGQLGKKRLVGAQDIAWALINTPAFLFNR